MRRAGLAVAALAGFLAGFLAARLRSPEEAPDSRPDPAAARRPADSAAATAAPAAAEVLQLHRELRRLREELARLQDLSAGPAAPDPRGRAKSIFETFRRALVDKEAPELLKALGSLDELDESTAAYFVERHREGIENAELRTMTLLLIQLSGGPDAAAFVVDRLHDPALPPAERDALLRNLSGTGIPENRKLPYGGELASTAETLLASAKPIDRMGGVGLLGGNDADDARVRLLRMSRADPDAQVRAAALASLGWVGDRATYEQLKAFGEPGPKEPHAALLRQSLERALAQLRRRFPD